MDKWTLGTSPRVTELGVDGLSLAAGGPSAHYTSIPTAVTALKQRGAARRALAP